MSGAKENEVYVVPSWDRSNGGLEGVFFRDTIYFDRWRWDLGGAQLLSRVITGNVIREIHCVTQPDRAQAVGLRRTLTVDEGGFIERWDLDNASPDPHTVVLRLELNPRMVDLFAARGEDPAEPRVERETSRTGATLFRRTAADGVVTTAALSCAHGLPDDLQWTIELTPGAAHSVEVDLRVSSTAQEPQAFPPLPAYDDWRASFASCPRGSPAVEQAIVDLRALLLRTEHGAYPAAGLPFFVNFFGRDALITGMMLLDWRPDLLRTVLEFLAARQGQAVDPFREEEPGKILHEIRRGELSRTGQIPFGRYYGSVDATPLFLMAAGAYFDACDDRAFAAQLRPAIEAATEWLADHLDGPSGLATFNASGSGLTVQSWKDSANSMVDEHGRSAAQPLAVAEVQGYSFAALLAAAKLLPERAEALTARAAALKEAFHAQYWLAELGTYAMALDAELKPLRVQSSDPGHLLWSGIVPEEIAPDLVNTLLGDELWSGWGLRTLGAKEAAYNPVSYHNGSVWPHDTGIFAMGLARYGFERELRMVAQALLDLADASPGRQMPELISGFARAEHPLPVPYTHANVPQAWSAAAVVRMAAYVDRLSDRGGAEAS